jgi:acetoin utilization deacetylase AcuC-like enzyme
MLDADTFHAPESIAAAKRAAGAAVELVDGLLNGDARWGLALMRPPGHHARPGNAMGFCLLNNVAVAAAHARSKGLERVAIIDFDVHHGNGTQEIFYDDPSVLYVSLHQFPYYPGTGAAAEIGVGAGRGYTVNVPLSAGAGDAVYVAAFERLLTPIVEQYRPDLLLVSAGFDAHERDPLGGMALTDAGYFAIARSLLTGLHAETPLGLVLEGGYDLSGLESAVASTVDALAGGVTNARISREIEASFERELGRATDVQRNYWHLD